jgi:hypothetical protein
VVKHAKGAALFVEAGDNIYVYKKSSGCLVSYIAEEKEELVSIEFSRSFEMMLPQTIRKWLGPFKNIQSVQLLALHPQVCPEKTVVQGLTDNFVAGTSINFTVELFDDKGRPLLLEHFLSVITLFTNDETKQRSAPKAYEIKLDTNRKRYEVSLTSAEVGVFEVVIRVDHQLIPNCPFVVRCLKR